MECARIPPLSFSKGSARFARKNLVLSLARGLKQWGKRLPLHRVKPANPNALNDRDEGGEINRFNFITDRAKLLRFRSITREP